MSRDHTIINFENLYQNAACGLITFRLDGSVLFANKTLLSWLEIDEKELLSRNFTEFLNKGGLFYYELFVLPLLRLHGEVKEVTLDINTCMGTFPCLFSASALSADDGDDNPIIQGALFKVTDRKKYENELLKKRREAEDQKREKANTLKEIGLAQSHLVRAPVANILGLLSLLNTESLNDDIKKIVLLLQSSAEQLDREVKNVVNKTYQKSL